jgi:hypothetical protein
MTLIPEKVKLTDDLGNDLLADVSISNLMQDITSKLIDNIHEKRNNVIVERLKELTGIDLDLQEEAQRRFKRLAIEYYGNTETIYFNDGSIKGKRIVTFERNDSPLTYEPNKTQMSMTYSYY